MQASIRLDEYYSIISPHFIHKTCSIKTNGIQSNLYAYKRNYKVDQI